LAIIFRDDIKQISKNGDIRFLFVIKGMIIIHLSDFILLNWRNDIFCRQADKSPWLGARQGRSLQRLLPKPVLMSSCS